MGRYKLSSKFPKKTNEWITEDVSIEVVRPEIDKKGAVKYKSRTETFTQKTMYIDTPFRTIKCKECVMMPHKANQFKCEKCNFLQVAHPLIWKYDANTKKLIRR
jgi:hypothetical protein